MKALRERFSAWLNTDIDTRAADTRNRGPQSERPPLRTEMAKYVLRRFLNLLFLGRFLKVRGLIATTYTDVIDGRAVTYNLASEIGKCLFYTGHFEKSELTNCEQYIARDSVVLDIGANLGTHAIRFASLADQGVVIAFEPAPSTFRLLTSNIHADRIIPINMAVSDATGLVDFFEAADDAYSSLKDTKRKPILGIRKVLAVRLDELFGQTSGLRVDFVKIDVEGYEHNVLVGMQSLIDRCRPVIFCEIYQGTNSNISPHQTVSLLTSRGYEAFVLTDSGKVPYERHVDDAYNYLFVPGSRVVSART
jgi:FkbM family methyltransferase